MKNKKIIPILLTTLSVAMILNACKKQGNSSSRTQGKARSIFVKGKVYVISAGKKNKLKLGAYVNAGESVKTEGSSIATLQLPDKTIIKILQNSEANFKSILDQKKNTEIENKGGQIFARIDKLKKGNRFQIRTVTSVAGVRGTEFLSVYTNGISKIHVKEGKVSIKTIIAGKVQNTSEKILTSGSIAEVKYAKSTANKKGIAVRKQNVFEKVLIAQIKTGTAPVDNLAAKTSKDLVIIEEQINKKQFQSLANAKTQLKKIGKTFKEYQEKVQLVNKPKVTLVLKDGSKIRGHIISQNAKYIKLNVGQGKVINIEKMDIIRRE